MFIGMESAFIFSRYWGWYLQILIGLVACLQTPIVNAQAIETTLATQATLLEQHKRASNNSYILGPGDGIEIELVDIPELSGRFNIGPDGTIHLPRLRALYVEGLTIEELRTLLTKRFQTYVIKPQVFVRPVTYRPIRVYVGGEVKRQGYYTLSGVQRIYEDFTNNANKLVDSDSTGLSKRGLQQSSFTDGNSNAMPILFPTVFDAIRTAQGITPYSNLARVEVIRRQAMSHGGGRIRTQLNFLSLINEGNESQNIRLFDGDVVNVGKSPTVLRDQLLKAGQSNLTPQFLQVYVSGRVEQAGSVTLPQGSSLLQAVNLAGGTKFPHGKVEFLRFTRDGTIDRRVFKLKSDAPLEDYRNPVLMAGDLIRVLNSPLNKSLSIFNELTQPAIGLYSTYSLFNNFSN